MSDAADHEKRSREIADTIRRFLVAVNTGGIGVSFGVAGFLAGQKVSPGWTAWPVAFFVGGLIVTAGSLVLAKHRELKRRDAALAKESEPEFKKWYWRSFTWDLVALAFFVAGSIVGLIKLQCIIVL
jgi:hypothetical protein